MNTLAKSATALLAGMCALGVAAASADGDERRDPRDNRDRREWRDDNQGGSNSNRESRSDDRRRGDNDTYRQGQDARTAAPRTAEHRRGDYNGDRRGRDVRTDHRTDDRSDRNARYDGRSDDRRGRDVRYDDRRGRDSRYDDRRYSGGRPDRCTLDHDHRYHSRDYYKYYPRDRYYDNDPGFSISLSFGNGGYYDRSGAYYDRPYYDQRGYRDYGRVVNRDVIRIRGYRAEALLVEEYFGGGRRGSDTVCTVTARGPDARYVPYGQLRSIAARYCSRRSDIRIYA